jgi:hypothetical protein
MEEIKNEVVTAKESGRGKVLTADQRWNSEGLLKDRKSEDGEVVLCTATKAPLYYFRKDGTKVMLATFCECVECTLPFHESYLHIPEGTDKSHWPIEYGGFHCKDCWSK